MLRKFCRRLWFSFTIAFFLLEFVLDLVVPFCLISPTLLCILFLIFVYRLLIPFHHPITTDEDGVLLLSLYIFGLVWLILGI